MIFSRHPLIYHIIFRFSHYPVVSTPLIAIYYILFTSFRSFHSFASPSSLCFDSSVVARSCSYPRGREEGAERRERKEDRKGETGGIVVRVRYRCRRDTGVVRIAVTATAGGGENSLLSRAPWPFAQPPFVLRRPPLSRTPFNPRALLFVDTTGRKLATECFGRLQGFGKTAGHIQYPNPTR